MEQVRAAILGSAEYYRRAGGTDAAFLSALYQDVLGRSIDPTGAANWGSALTHGMDRATLAQQVATSGEAEQDLVQGYYQQFLHRGAESAGLNAWVSQLQNGTHDEAILAGILGSNEYFHRL